MYRVHPLPESMRPLVWDFGQLTHHTEELYTMQIVRRFMRAPVGDVSTETEDVKLTRKRSTVCVFVLNVGIYCCRASFSIWLYFDAIVQIRVGGLG